SGLVAAGEARLAHRVDDRGVLPQLEVHVAAGDLTGLSRVANYLALRDGLAARYGEAAEVVVDTHVGRAVDDAMVDHHLVTGRSGRSGGIRCGNDARGCSNLSFSTDGAEVNAVVHPVTARD